MQRSKRLLGAATGHGVRWAWRRPPWQRSETKTGENQESGEINSYSLLPAFYRALSQGAGSSPSKEINARRRHQRQKKLVCRLQG